jgi:GNAT superfamily N-acetyltransferase
MKVISAIRVREAGPEDAEILAALQTEMDDAFGTRPDPDAGRMRTVLAEMKSYPWFRAYLATDEDGRAVGTFSLMVLSSPSHDGTPQALLDAVVVSAPMRGCGIGEAMIREAMRIAAAAGCYKMMLSSSLKRADAHRFYEKLGYGQHGISFSIDLR